ncbi:unnamed protein product [Cochlearia groenlandica]
MKLFMNIIMITIIIYMVCDQTKITSEARHLKLQEASIDTSSSTSSKNINEVGLKQGNVNVELVKYDFKHKETRKLDQTNGEDLVKEGSTDDFAPTNPGNSPGVGHRKGHANVKDDFKHTQRKMEKNVKGSLEHKEEKKIHKTNGQDQYFLTRSKDDFAPTYPGNSPGVGHRKGYVNGEGFKDALEHKEERKMNGQDHFINGSTDDFAPTSPGNSPGVGHKKGEDFKPTTPGHSPGVGHAFMENEPKA